MGKRTRGGERKWWVIYSYKWNIYSIRTTYPSTGLLYQIWRKKKNQKSSHEPIQPFFQNELFCDFHSLFSALDKFFHLIWLMSPLSSSFFFVCVEMAVEKTVCNGYKTTKSQLAASLKEITKRIESLMASPPLASQPPSFDSLPNLIENNNVIMSITLNRQCERFLFDLLNILADHQQHIERCLKNFRSQLNKIHEIVKFRTAIPITSIFVSIRLYSPAI